MRPQRTEFHTTLTMALPANTVFAVVILAAAMLSACGLPNLESPECAAASGVAKEFYSFHFGNEMGFSADTLKPREKFLTPELVDSVRGSAPDTDPFTTKTDDIPKAFRIGGCKLVDSGSARVEVVLFWRDDTRSEERKMFVEVVKRNDKWLINKLLN